MGVERPIEYLELAEKSVELGKSSEAGLKLGQITAGLIQLGLENEPQESPLATAINVLSSVAAAIGTGDQQLSRMNLAHLIVLAAGYLERELIHRREGGKPHDLVGGMKDIIEYTTNMIREAGGES